MNNKNNKTIIFRLIALMIALLLLVTTVYARGYDRNDRDEGYGMGYQDDDADRDKGKRYGRKGPGGRAMGFLGGMNLFDQNGDYEITRAEAHERIDLIFSDIDGDSDDQVSETEFMAFSMDKAKAMAEINYHNLTDADHKKIEERTQRYFSRLDEDSDSYLTKVEFSDQLETAFEKMDRNQDDVIDKSELKRRRR